MAEEKTPLRQNRGQGRIMVQEAFRDPIERERNAQVPPDLLLDPADRCPVGLEEHDIDGDAADPGRFQFFQEEGDAVPGPRPLTVFRQASVVQVDDDRRRGDPPRGRPQVAVIDLQVKQAQQDGLRKIKDDGQSGQQQPAQENEAATAAEPFGDRGQGNGPFHPRRLRSSGSINGRSLPRAGFAVRESRPASGPTGCSCRAS